MASSKLQHPAVDATVAVTLLALGASCERQTTTSTGPNTTTTASTVTPAPRIETAIDKAGDTLADPGHGPGRSGAPRGFGGQGTGHRRRYEERCGVAVGRSTKARTSSAP